MSGSETGSFKSIVAAAVAVALLGGASATALGAIVTGDAADVERNEDGTSGFAGATFRAGASTSSGGGRNGVFMFDLSPFAGQSFSSADVQLTVATTSGSPAFGVDLYGVGYATAASPFPAAADYYEGAFNGDVTNTTGLAAIQDNFLIGTIGNNGTVATSAAADSAVVNFINARPAGQNFVFFRAVPDADLGAAAAVGYNFHSANATTASFRPQLGLDQQVPEPTAMAAMLLGGAGLLLLRRRRVSAASIG